MLSIQITKSAKAVHAHSGNGMLAKVVDATSKLISIQKTIMATIMTAMVLSMVSGSIHGLAVQSAGCELVGVVFDMFQNPIMLVVVIKYLSYRQ